MEIRDPIHGNIDVNNTELKIIDTPQMQRMRYIKQLDLASLIFPGANHSRFEHSLGAMQVTKELVKKTYGDGENPEFSYVGLLHDIGHGPFSHLSEDPVLKHLKKDHEQIGEERIRNSEIKDIISDSVLSFNKVMDYFKEANKIDVVSGALGSDRIDYLMRDSHYTGVAYGVIDYERIKSRLVLIKGKIGILESGLSGAESMLIARYFMHLNVYSHHAVAIAKNMLRNAINIEVEHGALDPKELIEMYDDQLIDRLRNSRITAVSGIVKKIMERRMFKRAYYEPIKNDVDLKGLEEAIMGGGFEQKDFIVKQINLAGGKDDIDVIGSDGEFLGKLTDVSPLMKTLIDIITKSRWLLVACDRANTEKIGSIVKRNMV